MFALHEKTQRRVCRGIFMIACVVPTLVAVSWAAYANRPWRERDWQRTLAEQLHVRATLADVSNPRPGTRKLIKLRLADLRNNHELANFDKLDLEHVDGRSTLRADRCAMQADQVPALSATIATWLASAEREPFDFQAAELSIHGPDGQLVTLNEVTIRGVRSGAVRQFQLQATSADGKPLHLDLEHENGKIHCVLDTQQTALPAWLVGQFVPAVGGCGKALFHGTISATSDNQHTGGTLVGTLTAIDLQSWIGDTGRQRLHAVATIELEEFTWLDQRIETVRGSIATEGGSVTQSVLAAMCKYFGCTPASGWEAILEPQSLYSATMVPFEKLAMSFQLRGLGTVIVGQCHSGALLVGDAMPLLYGPPPQDNAVFPTGNFVNVFHLPRRGWLPDTRAALNMGRELPLPGDEATQEKTIKR